MSHGKPICSYCGMPVWEGQGAGHDPSSHGACVEHVKQEIERQAYKIHAGSSRSVRRAIERAKKKIRR